MWNKLTCVQDRDERKKVGQMNRAPHATLESGETEDPIHLLHAQALAGVLASGRARIQPELSAPSCAVHRS
jgi:hypothetical protein